MKRAPIGEVIVVTVIISAVAILGAYAMEAVTDISHTDALVINFGVQLVSLVVGRTG